MKSLVEYIKEIIHRNDYHGHSNLHDYLVEMATIEHNVKLGKDNYQIAIHGPSSKDRENPHIHIYLANDNTLKKFNFEISLTDILCKDEINLIRQTDKTKRKKIDIKNRNKCSWEGYSKLKYDFEDWLEEKHKSLPKTFKTNLDAIIWNYNHESEKIEKNYLLKYIEDRGLKILPHYKKYFDEETIEENKQLFK